MIDFDFDVSVKKKKPLWKDLMVFAGTVFTVWGSTHVFMNYPAYAQIVQYKLQNLKASVSGTLTPVAEETSSDQSQELRKVQRIPRTTFRNKDLRPRNQAKKLFEGMEIYPSDNRLVIPRIAKNVPLVTVPNHHNWNQLEQNIQGGLQEGVVVHPISHAPGNYGNFFVTGHSSFYAWDPGRFKDVFALLHEVKIGDLVEVYWEGKKYTYKIRKQQVVPPTATEVLQQPSDQSILTLMTCTPVGTNKNRLILVGEIKEEH